jgi:penicillin-binding protein 1A
LLTSVQSQHLAIQSTTAALLTAAMEDVLESGTGTLAAVPGVHLAGKSGTSSGVREAWIVGFSPELACGVWGGYDDFAEQGSGQYVKKIWKAVMSRSHEVVTGTPFAEMEGLISREICMKCGDLAVEGLCDNTVQGDQTRMERFAPGTEPTENCTCHAAVSLCAASGGVAGRYCPAGEVEQLAYVVEGTVGTPDAEAVLDSAAIGVCTVHDSWWDRFFPEEDLADPVPSRPEPPGRGEQHGGWFGWWDWFRF